MTTPRSLQGFLDLARAFEDERGMLENCTALRYAAISLLDLPAAPAEVARRLQRTSRELHDGTGWFDPMRADLRYLVAAELLRRDVPPSTFRVELENARRRFRTAGLKHGAAYELIAQMILIARAAGGHVEPDVVQRFSELYAGMHEHHFWLTGTDDYPACAILAAVRTDPGTLIERTEFFYEGLRDLRFQRGNALQFVSHVLSFNACSDREALRRFHEIWHTFRAAGLHMHSGDYDEVAVLTFLERSANEIVDRVLEHREPIAQLRPRPSKDLSFSMACSTALLELVPDDAALDQLERARRAAGLQALIQAQQVAAVSMSSAAGSA